MVDTFQGVHGAYTSRPPFNTSSISIKEMIQAEKDIIKSVQEEAFQKEISILGSTEFRKATDQRKIKSIRPHQKLNPVLKNGILRVGGRIENAPIDTDARHSVILPNKHHLTDLIVHHYHLKLGHLGVNMSCQI